MEKNTFERFLENLKRKSESSTPKSPSDYYHDDGLLYCGKCNTPKQCIVHSDLDGRDRVFSCVCKCEREEEEKVEAELKRQAELCSIDKLKENSLMDEKFKTSSFESSEITPENKKQIYIAKRYAEKFDELYERNQGLLFWGDVGTGKTHIACCIGNFLMDRLIPVFTTSFIKLLKSRSFQRGEEEQFIRKMNVAKLLILDDLGAERGTDYALEVVYNIIDSRYRAGKPMIITTNLSLSEMQKEPNMKLKRIYDRIFEVCYPVEFRGKSLRMKEAAGRFDSMKRILEEENENKDQ